MARPTSTTDVEIVISTIRECCNAKRSPILVAIDGKIGAGKSTLAQLIADTLDATTIAGDNFFVGKSDQQWLSMALKERVQKVIDWRRLKQEVLIHLLQGKQAKWRAFDFVAGEGLSKEEILSRPKDIIILEGIYSARPELADLIDLKIFVDENDTIRRQRLINREDPAQMQKWHQIWDDAEDYYFHKICPPDGFDLIFSWSD